MFLNEVNSFSEITMPEVFGYGRENRLVSPLKRFAEKIHQENMEWTLKLSPQETMEKVLLKDQAIAVHLSRSR